MTAARAALKAIAALHKRERIEPEAWDNWYAYDRCSTCGGNEFPCPTRAIVDPALEVDDEAAEKPS